MKRWMICMVISLVLALCVTAPAVAGAPVLDRIVKSGELRVGMSGTQPPLNVKSKTGELIGLEVDLARLLANAIGVEAKLVAKPFPELLPALEAGEVDIVMSGLTITPERNMRVAFVGPYMVSGKSILTKSTTLAAAAEASDIDDSRITLTALKNSTSQRFVEKLIPRANLVTTDSYDASVQMVLDDKADAMVADMPICMLTVLRHPEAELATLTQPLTIEPIGIALPANDPLFLNLMQNYLVSVEGTGILELLQQKWFENGNWIFQLP